VVDGLGRRLGRSAWALVALLWGVASVGAAQEPTGPPDVIYLNDGTMYRGTIAERVPGSHVVVVLITGEVRRVPMDDVKYAGPAAEAPVGDAADPDLAKASPHDEASEPHRDRALQDGADGARPEASPKKDEPPAGWLRLRLEANRPGVSLYAGPPGGRLDRLCLAPCEVFVEPGRYRFAARHGTGDPVFAETRLTLDQSTTVEAIYDARQGVRVGGWVLFGLGSAAAVASAIGIAACGSECRSAAPIVLIPLAVVIVGLIMVSLNDRLSVHRSRTAPPPRGSGRPPEAARRAPSPTWAAARAPASP
jgi:hypothetical protein